MAVYCWGSTGEYILIGPYSGFHCSLINLFVLLQNMVNWDSVASKMNK